MTFSNGLITVIATLSFCAIALFSCKEKGELYIHYTPEELDSKTQAVINAIKNNPMFPSTDEGLEAFVNKLAGLSYEQYAAGHPVFSDEYQLDSIIGANGYKTLILKYKGNRDNNLPEANIIYTHGGGFILPMTNCHRDFCQRLAKQINFTVYMPLYPLAPNNYVQTPLDFLTDLYKKVKTDGKPVYIMGDSAGGNITLALGLYLKSLGEEQPDAFFGISPVCEYSGSYPQMLEYNKKDIMLPMVVMNKIYSFWRPEDMSVSDVRVSPIYGDWTGMPQTFLFAGTDESFYPEIMETAQKMKDAGMLVGVLVGNYLFHTAPCYQIPVMDQYFQEITEFLYGSEKVEL